MEITSSTQSHSSQPMSNPNFHWRGLLLISTGGVTLNFHWGSSDQDNNQTHMKGSI